MVNSLNVGLLRISAVLFSSLNFAGVPSMQLTSSKLEHQSDLWIGANVGRVLEAIDGAGRRRKKQPDLSAEEVLLPPVQPFTLSQGMKNRHADPRSITLTEDPISVTIRDPDWNFGTLTDEQMDQILRGNGLFFDSPPPVRVIGEAEGDSTVHIVKIPPQNVGQDALQIGIDELEGVPGTSGVMDQMPSTETIDKLALPQPPRSETELVVPPTKRQLSPQPDLSQQPARKKQKKAVDKNTQLSAAVMHKHREDLFFQTRGFESSTIQLSARIDAIKLLNTPSTHNQRAWAKPLCHNYHLVLSKPITVTATPIHYQSDQSRERQTPPPPDLLRDIVRAPDTFTPERPEELSKDTMFIKTLTSLDDTSKKDQTKTLEHIYDATVQGGLLQLAEGQNGAAESTDQVEPLPEISEDVQQPHKVSADLPENTCIVIRDWMDNGQLHSSRSSSIARSGVKDVLVDINSDQEKFSSGSQPRSYSRLTLPSGTDWVRGDLLGNLGVLWSENSVIEFKDICPPSSSTKRDAYQIFVILLDLQKSKEVRLSQEVPYGPICIEKC